MEQVQELLRLQLKGRGLTEGQRRPVIRPGAAVEAGYQAGPAPSPRVQEPMAPQRVHEQVAPPPQIQEQLAPPQRVQEHLGLPWRVR